MSKMPHRGEMFLQAFADSVITDTLPQLYVTGVDVDVLRTDLIHPEISGNKWFKLRYYLADAVQSGQEILTFGGAWSNHILATAFACRHLQIPCTGIIRGEEPPVLSATLKRAREAGMNLRFISRSAYAFKSIPDDLSAGNYILVPEGGFGNTGARGAATMADHIKDKYTHVLCAVGTGTMMAGLINALETTTTIIGVPVLKNISAGTAIESLVSVNAGNWWLAEDYAFGGYAKYNLALIDFMNSFFQATGIPTDFVYTGKLFYAAMGLLRQERIPQGSRVLIIHSGGLQGNAGLPHEMLMF